MQHLTSLQFDLIILATLTIGMAIGVLFTAWWYTRPEKKHPEIRPIYKRKPKQQVYTFDETNIYNN